MNNNELAEKITLLEKRISNLESLMSPLHDLRQRDYSRKSY